MGQETSSLKSLFPQDKSIKKLQSDLRQLINDERFHDIALECSDGVTIFGCNAILATRSNIFSTLIFSENNDSLNSLSFNDINSNAMKVILEYLYTSAIVKGKEGINVNNVIEVYYASIHFDLEELKDYIIRSTKSFISKDENANVSKKLLSECVEKFSLLDNDNDNKMSNNEMSRILVDWVAKNKLETNEIDSLSLKGLEYFLMATYNTKKPFATPEFEIWEYALKKVTREISPTITSTSQEIFNNPQIKSHLKLLNKWIDLKRMNAEGIKKYVEPFNILPVEKFKKTYYFLADENNGLGFIRGVPIFKWKFKELNKQLEISNGGFTVKAIEELKEPKSILGDMIFKGKGVYEWNIFIKKLCGTIYIGICDINEDLSNTDQKYHGWVLGSDGYVYRKKEWKWYDARFKEGDKVTVHLDMKTKSCAFSINRVRKPMVPDWDNKITSQVYPIVSLGRGSIVYMEPYIPDTNTESFF